MENSINFIHPLNTIKSSTDGKLYKKAVDKWEEISNILYKSEKYLPSNNLGNNGDYYAYYNRQYNYIIYSEDFSKPIWNKTGCKINYESSVKFPINNSYKLIASEKFEKHNLDYRFYNDLKQTYTFSIYIRKNEISNVALSLSDKDDTYGEIIKVNLLDNTFTVSDYGNTNDISENTGNIEIINKNVVRIWVSAQFKTTLILKATIKLLNDKGEEEFLPLDDSDGLFINAAQLVKSSQPENYVISNGEIVDFPSLINLYIKINDNWVIADSTLYYLSSKPKSTIGNEGDVACVDSLIKLSPAILAGDGSNINLADSTYGALYYSKSDDKWYVKAKKGVYSLEIKNPSPDYYGVAMAISLNQQSYQTYYNNGKFSHRLGFNTGGSYNFWANNLRKSRL
jgi:hypothetical protein